MSRRRLAAAGLILLALAAPCAADSWSRATLARLSLAQKVGQMIGVRAAGLRRPGSLEARRLRDQIGRLNVGTVVVFESEVDTLPGILD
ncbi:MAG TPA: hypothetical protein VMV21_07410, partial [Vicinamibacteria bacterium]|nr:hypothetical protein [Vicinamibacteria bacterium]